MELKIRWLYGIGGALKEEFRATKILGFQDFKTLDTFTAGKEIRILVGNDGRRKRRQSEGKN